MPVQKCTRAGKRGWKYGESGFCYIGPSAKQKAHIQGAAIKRSQKARGQRIDIADVILEGLNRGVFEFNKKTLGRIPPVWLYPNFIEIDYRRYLQNINRILQQGIEDNILKSLPRLVEEADINKPKTDAYPDAVERLMDNLRVEVNSKIVGQKAKLIDIGQKTSDWNNKEWRKTMNTVMGINVFQREPFLNDTINSFVEENATLIQDLQEKTYRDIEGIVQRGIRSGKRHEEIRGEIVGTKITKGVFKKLETRINLIARDQVSKLNGQLTQLRQTNIGIKEYIWRTSEDERVRTSHAAKNGNKYRWNKPPVDTGHPGEDYQCRCWAEAVFDELLEEFAPDRPLPLTLKEQKEIIGMFDKTKTREDIIGVMRKHKSFAFINDKAFNRLAADKTLQMGLFKMRAGNLLAAAIRRSGKKIVTVKKVAAPAFRRKAAAYETKASLKFMDETFDKKVEHAAIFNRKTGKEIWRSTDNKKHTVNINAFLARDNYLIHSHPLSKSFSWSDTMSANVIGETASDIVSSKYIYRMRNIKQYKITTKTGKLRKATGLEFTDKYANTYDKIKDAAVVKYQRLVNLEKISVADANIELTHETIKNFAKKTGLFTYSRVPFKPSAIVKPVAVIKPKVIKKPIKLKAEAELISKEWIRPRFNKLTVEDLGIKESAATKKYINKIVKKDHEILGVFDIKTRKQLAEIHGEKNTIKYGKKIEKLTKGNHTIHNHVWDDFWENEPSFSYADIKYSFLNGEGLSQVVTKNKNFYIYNIKTFKGNEKKFDSLYKKKYSKILHRNERKFSTLEATGKIKYKEVDFLTYDNTAREFINEVGLGKYGWVNR